MRHITELSPGRRARFDLRHALRSEVLSYGLEVKLHLFAQQPLPLTMGEQKP
jgi:transcriptional regulator of met regulon